MTEFGSIFSLSDICAFAYFLLCWIAFNYLTDNSSLRNRSVSHHIDLQRAKWMKVMAIRPLRMVDTSILAGLQNGTAFFGSTCLLAIGGCFALLGSAEDVQRIYKDLPLAESSSAAEWEAKLLGLIAVFSYSFFKFGWAYRLFNYCSIAVGAVPEWLEGQDTTREPDEETKGQIARATRMNQLAGKHFNLGLRGIFMALGYIGWFLGPILFMITTTLIIGVMIRRQFFSAAYSALKTT